MKLIVYSILLMLSVNYCGSKHGITESSVTSEPQGYYSDYFVFIADDDKDSPLVVPIDINWTLFEESYDIEYKSWYGTEQDWPIEYFKNQVPAKISGIPTESFDHPDTENFFFNKEERTIETKISGNHEIQIQIPDKKEWVLATSESDFPTYAFKTDIRVDGISRSGWMLYERIRFDQFKAFDGFAAFYWMPIVVNDNLYHFTAHKGEQTAVKWSIFADSLSAEMVPEFSFKIVETIADLKSKRSEIAKTVHIQVPEWELDITLNSKGEQLGYGGEHPKGLAVFRQSLLQADEGSRDSGYGMMELILADN